MGCVKQATQIPPHVQPLGGAQGAAARMECETGVTTIYIYISLYIYIYIYPINIYEIWTLIVYTNHTTESKFPRRTPPRAYGRRPGRNADSAIHKRPGTGLAGVRSGLAAELQKFQKFSSELCCQPRRCVY